jgi:hypothetical protein
MYLFGKTISGYTLHAYEDGHKLGSIPAQTYSVHVFDEMPTRADAAAGTGAIDTFTVIHTANEFLQFDIPAIDDPDPTSLTNQVTYWLAVVFELETGEQDQMILRALPLSRVTAKNHTIGVTSAKIKEAFPDVENYLSVLEIESQISIAQMNLLEDLQNKGFRWAEINRPEQLFNALLFKSLEYIHTSQIQRQGDRFSISAEMAHRNYTNIISNLKLAIENDKGEITTPRQTGGTIWVSR